MNINKNDLVKICIDGAYDKDGEFIINLNEQIGILTNILFFNGNEILNVNIEYKYSDSCLFEIYVLNNFIYFTGLQFEKL
jgi:hypothetical protein